MYIHTTYVDACIHSFIHMGRYTFICCVQVSRFLTILTPRGYMRVPHSCRMYECTCSTHTCMYAYGCVFVSCMHVYVFLYGWVCICTYVYTCVWNSFIVHEINQIGSHFYILWLSLMQQCNTLVFQSWCFLSFSCIGVTWKMCQIKYCCVVFC